MSSSPRSMWSGTISLGLLNIPVSIGKSWSDEREGNLRDLCAIHGEPVDRTERCPTSIEDGLNPSCTLQGGKQKGVQLEDGTWRKLNENEYAKIEEATKSDTLEILDVQPVYDLPWQYTTGTYYIRFNDKAKGHSPDAYAHFVATLAQKDQGAVVKWCKSARQQLAIIHTDGEGHLLLSTVPFQSEWREPGQKENLHQGVEISAEVVEQMASLLNAMAAKEFDYSSYADQGLKLRQEAVEKILGGEKLQDKQENKGEGGGQNVPDLMSQLKASIAEQKVTTEQKEQA